MDNNYVINGPEIPNNISFHRNKSLSQYLIDISKSRKSSILTVDPITEKQLTVGDVLEQSFEEATQLQYIGCKAGESVGIISENRTDFIVHTLAILNIGAIVTTINPMYTTGELIQILNITKPRFIILLPQNLNKLLQIRYECPFIVKIIVITDNMQIKSDDFVCSLSSIPISKKSSYNDLPVKCNPDDVALILYSSGTTGFPKAVCLKHENVVYILECTRSGIFPDFGEFVIGNLPMFHGFGMYINFTSLTIGFGVVAMNKFEQTSFLSYIQKYKVKMLFAVPPIVVFLSKSPLIEFYDLSSLKTIFSGAAPLSEAVKKCASEKLNVKFREGYGMTELTFASHITVEGKIKDGSIGRLLPGVQCKVVDIDSGKSLGPNQYGEFHTRGPLVMKGYYGNPEQTNNIIDKDGWVHTGDIGYYDEDEDFFIVDRIKELIKYKAYQVSPAEIENLLLKHESVEDCGVVGIPDEFNNELPKAFVVKKPGATVTENDIIRYVERNISAQKWLRGGVSFINEIPKNPSGKILRRQLRSLVKSKI